MESLNKYMRILTQISCSFLLFFAIVVLGQAADSLGDPFDGNSLRNPNWEWSNEPKKWDIGKTKDGWLTIAGEHNRNLWGEDQSNRLFQKHSGDFHIETNLIHDYKDVSTVQGIVALSKTAKDNKGRTPDWVTLKLWGRGGDDKNAVLQYQARERDNEPGLIGTAPAYGQVKQGALPMYMRMQRKKDTFTTWFKLNEGDKWNLVGEYKSKLKDPLEVGIYSGIADGAGGKLIAHFEYFKDLDNPFTVESKNKLSTIWGQIKSSE
jgi:hypothetical protein